MTPAAIGSALGLAQLAVVAVTWLIARRSKIMPVVKEATDVVQSIQKKDVGGLVRDIGELAAALAALQNVVVSMAPPVTLQAQALPPAPSPSSVSDEVVARLVSLGFVKPAAS